ncbi:MAG: anti-sigma F factor [Clostridia bacterium]|nr:anti-sigma F factor [Clostridia bacterium]
MKSKCINKLQLTLPALSVNESVARAIVSAFCAQLNPTIEELADIKCAVSEAVTNCIVHAYRETTGDIYISVRIFDTRTVRIEIKDKGCGIEDIELVKTPLYTTDTTGERSGMGFAVMESFMDKLTVRSAVGKYTKVTLVKTLSPLEL